MSVNKPMGKTGNATIDQQGQTASGQFGDDPNLKTRGRGKPRDLTPKSGR